MKQKKQTEKKLSLKKLQMVRVSNPKAIIGGGCSRLKTMLDVIDDDGEGGNTGTIGTSRKD